MSYTIALNFEDGVTRFIRCGAGETVADAAYHAGVNIPLDCRDGACGTCKSLCESGRYDGGGYIDDALTAEEAAAGYCLPCQMRPHSDCVLRIPTTSTACRTGTGDVMARISDVHPLSPATFELALSTGGPVSPAFLPGQYVNITVPGGGGRTRAYSFSSPPGAEVLTFLIRAVPGGLMSTYLAERARPGDLLTLNGPRGTFYLRDVCRPVLMLAGGTGLAPFLSMLGRLAAIGCDHPVHLVYGVSRAEDLVKADMLAAYAAAIPGFSYTTCVSDPAGGHARTGHVTDHIPAETLRGGDVDVYLCGPPPMVDAARRYFHDRGITPTGFHVEKFVASVEGAAA